MLRAAEDLRVATRAAQIGLPWPRVARARRPGRPGKAALYEEELHRLVSGHEELAGISLV